MTPNSRDIELATLRNKLNAETKRADNLWQLLKDECNAFDGGCDDACCSLAHADHCRLVRFANDHRAGKAALAAARDRIHELEHQVHGLNQRLIDRTEAFLKDCRERVGWQWVPGTGYVQTSTPQPFNTSTTPTP